MNKTISYQILFLVLAIFCGQNSVQASENQTIRANQVFQFWDKYLTLPAHLRDGFNLIYTISSRGGPLPELYLVNGNQRTRIQTDRNGVVLNPPDLENFRRAIVEGPNARASDAKSKGMGISVNLDIEPIIPLGRTIQISAINNALSDYREGMRLAGGPASALAPRFTSIKFKGAQTGVVNFADGRHIPLLMRDQGLIFTPGASYARGAVNLAFNAAPNKAEYAR